MSTPWSEHRRGVSSEIGSPSAPCSQLDNSDASHAMEYEAQSTSYRVQSVCLPFFFFLFFFFYLMILQDDCVHHV